MNLNFTEIAVVIAVLAFSISIHESIHSIVAYFLGDDSSHEMGRFSLNPFNHVDPLTTIALPLVLLLAGAPPFAVAKPVMVDTNRLKGEEWGMALVAVSGPLSNLAIAFLASFLLKSVDVNAGGIYELILFYSVTINVGLGVFNLIPFPPLDGSRVLYAIAPDFLRKVLMQIEQLGFAAIIFFMFILYPMISSILQKVNLWFLNLYL